VLFLCVAAFSKRIYQDSIQAHEKSKGDVVAKPDDLITLPLNPKSENIQGVDHYYMLPQVKAKGVLIFLHSCKQSGLEFFHLPEDRIVAYDALNKGLAVFAPTSKDRESGCFTEIDVGWIDKVVDEWAANHELAFSPRIGMSVSSGSSLMFYAYKALKLKSMAVYNTPQSFHKESLEKGLAIPTAYITMPLDEIISSQMKKNFDRLSSAKVSTRLFEVHPHPFTPSLCLTRFPEIVPKDCEEIFRFAHKNFPRLFNGDDFLNVKESMASSRWQKLLTKVELNYELNETYYQKSQAASGHSWLWAIIEEEARSSQGFHAMTAEHHSSILNFLIQHSLI